MYEKRKTYLSYWRVFSLIVIGLSVILIAVFPVFFNSNFGFMDLFAEKFSFEKEVFFAPGDPCVDLDGTLPSYVKKIGNDYYINESLTLCTKTYSLLDANSPNNNGAIIIDASNIVINCNNSIITNVSISGNEWRGITAKNVVNVSLINCAVRGFGTNLAIFNVSNSFFSDIQILSSGIIGFEVNQSGNNYFNEINLSVSLGTGIYFLQSSLGNVINNSFFNKVAENTVYSIGSSNQTSILNSVFYNCSYTDSGENGVIRELSSRGAFVDNVKIYYGIRGFVNDMQNSLCGGDIIRNFYMTNASDTGIQIREDCPGVMIDNATIFYSKRMGIEISSANNIINNSFIAFTDAGTSSPYAGITFRSSDSVSTGNKLANSLFLNNSPSGIDIGSDQTDIEIFNVRSYDNLEYNLMINPYLQNSNTVVNIINSNFYDSHISSRDIYVYSQGYVQNITLLNTSFYNLTISRAGIKQINTWWWADVLASDSSLMPIQGVNISARDRNNLLFFSELTGSDGTIERQKVLQSIDIGPEGAVVSVQYNNYTFYAEHPSAGESLTQSWNMSTSRNLSFIFDSGGSYFLVNFTNPTPANGSSQINNFIYVNLSTENTKEHYSFVDFDNSLVAWLRMDDMVNPTTVRDLSGYGNNGTLMGGVVVNSSGRFGNGSWFDGVNDWINLEERVFNYENRAISVWFNSRNVSTNTYIFNSGGVVGNDKLYLEIIYSQLLVQVGNDPNYFYIPQTLNNNQWYHVAVSYANSTNGNVSIYFNGDLVDSHLTNLSGASGVNIGSYNDGNVNFWNGTIDEVLIFNRALSSGEVKSLYNSSAYKYENNFTKLGVGVHNFKGYGVDYKGMMNFTEARKVTVSSYSDVFFNWPTPLNGSINKLGYFNINASIIESNLTNVIFNWNGLNYSLYDNSLVFMMNFDNKSLLGENSTHVKDLSRYGRNGAVIGAVWNASGKYGGAYDFNGTNRISISPLIKANNTNYTYSLWLNWKQAKSLSFFMGQAQANVGSFTITSNQFRFRETSFPYYFYPFTTSIPYFNKWVHLTYVFTDRNNNIDLYINGVYNSSVSGLSSNAISFNGIGDGYGSPNGLNGSIDELMIWNRSLSEEEISKVYFMNLQKYNPELWYLSIDQTKNVTAVLDEGDYSYSVSVKNVIEKESISETRRITIKYSPNIIFSSPTPEDGATIGRNFFIFNFSIFEDTNGLRTAGFNWGGVNYTLLNDSLVLMYNFDNISALGETYLPCGSVKDLSRYGNNGRLSNASCSLERTPAWNSTGKYGGAFEFFGNGLSLGQSILVPHNNLLNPGSGDFSLALWYRPRNSRDGDILRKGSGTTGANEFYNLEHSTGFLLNSNRLCFELDTTAGNYQIVTKNSYNDRVWHHIFVQRKGGVAEIWIDGVNQEVDYYRNDAPSTAFSISGSISNTKDLTIGSKDDQASDFTNGSIDELRIYMRSFNEGEIKQLYYSNLYKYNANKWGLTVNESLSYRSFNYSGYMQDGLGVNVSTEVRRVNGFPEIYGELDSCRTLNLANGYYVMNASITNHTFRGACINITANNIILDCKGYPIFSESNQTGIYSNALNTIIQNCDVSVGRGNMGVGIALRFANNSVINNISLGNNREGIYLRNSHSADISFIYSDNNSECDVILDDSNGNSLSHLFLRNSICGITLYSSKFNDFNLFNMSRMSDGIILGLSENNTFYDFSLDHNSHAGIFSLDSSSNNTFNNFNVSNSLHGIYLQESRDNHFDYFNIKNSINEGIHIHFLSYFNDFLNFTIEDSTSHGIYVAGISNYFYNGVINNTGGNAIHLSEAGSDENSFRNIGLFNTDNSSYDLRFDNAGIDETLFIDMPLIRNYSFEGAGGRVGFRNSLYGEINFLEAISGAGTNLSNDIRIKYNSAVVESVLRPGLNRSANISLYGLPDDFNPPAIFRDGAVCPVEVCHNFTSLNAGDVVFSVDSWTEYYISTNINADIPPLLFFEEPTPEHRAITLSRNVFINMSIVDIGGINGRRGIDRVIFNWNGVNYSLYDDSVVLKYNLDNRSLLGENDTHVKDLSKYGNNGTVRGASFNLAGKYGGAYQFDGSGDYINISDTNGNEEFNFGNNTDKSYTISVWVYPRTLGEGSNARIYDKCPATDGTCSNGYVAYIRSGTMGRDLRVFNNANYLDVPGAFSSFYNWAHVLVAFNDSNKNLTVYINGRVNASKISISPSSIAVPLMIGNKNSLDRTFDGFIDEFTAWNRTLSVSEVKQIYDSNLYKHDFNRWGLYVNESSLIDGVYEYLGAARDLDNNWGMTDRRGIITIGDDVLPPNINFTNPTPPNASIKRGLYADINISIDEYETGVEEVNFSWDGIDYHIYDKDVILMMNFDNQSSLGENGSFIRDVSRYGNNGTVRGGARWSSNGKSGGAFYLDNVNDYIAVNPNSFPTRLNEYTIETWVNISSAGSDNSGMIYSRNIPSGNSVIMYFGHRNTQGNQVGLSLAHNSVATHDIYKVNIGEWNHLVTRYNGTRLSLFVNGAEVWSLLANPIETSSTCPLLIGVDADSGCEGSLSDDFLNGLIDEFSVWNKSLSNNEITQLYFSELYMHSSNKWNLLIRQGKNETSGLVDMKNYSYFASARDFAGNSNRTETRVITSNLAIADIDDLGYLNIIPGGMRSVNFSVYILAGTSFDIGAVSVNLSNGIISRSDSSCQYVGVSGGNLFNYSCSIDLWYFDSPGEWAVNSFLYDSFMSLYDSYNESFVLMSEASIQHTGSLNWGSVAGGTSASVPFLLNNKGNTAFNSFYIFAKNLLRANSAEPVPFIPASNFYMDDALNVGSCSGYQMEDGSLIFLEGVTLAVGNNSINSLDDASGQRRLYACFNVPDDPANIPPGDYIAADSNSWRLTSWPEHDFIN